MVWLFSDIITFNLLLFVNQTDKLIYGPSLSSCVKSIIEELVHVNYLLDLNDVPDFVLVVLNLSDFILNLFKFN